MAERFRLVLGFVRKDTGKNVHLKPDGQRFSEPTTIKFNTNTVYISTVTIRPARILRSVNIHGLKTELVQKNPQSEDATSSCYTTEWNSQAFEVTKSGKRNGITFVFEFDNGATMKCAVQAKFYPEKETDHCHWGDSLKAIEYECSIPDGGTFVNVLNTRVL